MYATHLLYGFDSVHFFLLASFSLLKVFIISSRVSYIHVRESVCPCVYVLASVSETLSAAFTEIREIYVLWVFVSLGFFFGSLNFVAKRLLRV